MADCFARAFFPTVFVISVFVSTAFLALVFFAADRFTLGLVVVFAAFLPSQPLVFLGCSFWFDFSRHQTSIPQLTAQLSLSTQREQFFCT